MKLAMYAVRAVRMLSSTAPDTIAIRPSCPRPIRRPKRPTRYSTPSRINSAASQLPLATRSSISRPRNGPPVPQIAVTTCASARNASGNAATRISQSPVVIARQWMPVTTLPNHQPVARISGTVRCVVSHGIFSPASVRLSRIATPQ